MIMLTDLRRSKTFEIIVSCVQCKEYGVHLVPGINVERNVVICPPKETQTSKIWIPYKKIGSWKQEITLKLRLKKLKKIKMLPSTDDLYFACLERFKSHYQYFRLKSRFFNFCKTFIPDFENLHYLLHLNKSEDDVSEEKDLENDSSVEIRDVNTSS